MAPILTRVGQAFGFGAPSGGGGGGGGAEPGGHEASGGYKSDYADPTGQKWRAHVFTSDGSFNVTALSGSNPATAEVLMVAGGGGGGCLDAGGGGGGAVLYRKAPNIPIDVSNSPVIIGKGGYSGGNTAFHGPTGKTYNTRGGNTKWTHPNFTCEVMGGGAGAPYSIIPTYGIPQWRTGWGRGGSGGGGANGNDNPGGNAAGWDNHPGGTDIESNPGGFGKPGGIGDGNDPAGGGGVGGATQAGGNYTGPEPAAGKGGDGAVYTLMTGANLTYGGGGGGGRQNLPNGPAGAGGAGGGGAGGVNNLSLSNGQGPDNHGKVGMDIFGGGGGGAGGTSGYANCWGGSGGGGSCVIRYKLDNLGGTAKATGGLISYYNNKVIHAFFTPGTFNCDVAIPSAEIVILAGGGGGGGVISGGGGAGGYHTATTSFPPAAVGVNLPMHVGKGGSGGAGGTCDPSLSPNNKISPAIALVYRNTNGEYSALYTTPTAFFRVEGGGGGGQYCGQPGYGSGTPGGSGGGAAVAGGNSQGDGNKQNDGNAAGGGPLISPTNVQGNDGYVPTGGDAQTVSGGGGGGYGSAGKAGTAGGSPDANARGGDGGLGVKLPATFQDPSQDIGYPGPDGTKHWVAGGGGGGYQCTPGGFSDPTNQACGGVGGGGVEVPAAPPTHYPEKWDGSFCGAGNGAGAQGVALAPGYATRYVGPPGNEWPGGYNAQCASGSGGGGGTGTGGGMTAGSAGGKGGSGLILIAYPEQTH